MRRQGGGLDFSIDRYKIVLKNRVETFPNPIHDNIFLMVKLRLLPLHSSITNPLSLLKKEG